jgi:hypothetical protein
MTRLRLSNIPNMRQESWPWCSTATKSEELLNTPIKFQSMYCKALLMSGNLCLFYHFVLQEHKKAFLGILEK